MLRAWLLLTCITTGWYTTDKHYHRTDESGAYAAATLRHPDDRLREGEWGVKRLWRENGGVGNGHRLHYHATRGGSWIVERGFL